MTPEPATFIMLGILDVTILFLAWVTHRKVLALREDLEINLAALHESSRAP